jgi:hypothetical protein
MIKHELKDDLIYLSIDKKDFSHRIPVEKIGKAIQWTIGKNKPEGIIIRNVSKYTLRLFTQNVTDSNYVEQFQNIVHQYAPKNNIDWKATLLALKIQNEYHSRIAVLKATKDEMTEDQLIAILEAKYNLD